MYNEEIWLDDCVKKLYTFSSRVTKLCSLFNSFFLICWDKCVLFMSGPQHRRTKGEKCLHGFPQLLWGTTELRCVSCLLIFTQVVSLEEFQSYFSWSWKVSNCCRCHRCLQQVKQEYCLVKNKLETLLRVTRQRTLAEEHCVTFCIFVIYISFFWIIVAAWAADFGSWWLNPCDGTEFLSGWICRDVCTMILFSVIILCPWLMYGFLCGDKFSSNVPFLHKNALS